MVNTDISMSEGRQKVLIADDSEMNRSILTDMLGDDFETIEVADGVEAVEALKKYGTDISLVLLDIVMPNMDGFDVLAAMNKYNWIRDIPVIIISSESNAKCIERAYDLGAVDYISRPFDALIVQKRAVNTIMLYAKQKKLVGLVAEQIQEKEKNNSIMISILSHIVEFRNGESGLHVMHINVITNILLRRLMQKTNQYKLSNEDISMIAVASALHDIGKISIPEEVLNKPGRLTDEEFAIMKNHSALGAQMLESIPLYPEEKLLKIAHDVCRWHHERYDGRGYPDGLKGEEIPISAQVVSIADVYDALTSERVYKSAFSHEKAMEMIINGECGAFNPILLECLKDEEDTIQRELKVNSFSERNRYNIHNVTEELLQCGDLSVSERTMKLLEKEREKYQFFTAVSNEIFFEYTMMPPVLTLSASGAEKMGIDEVITNPLNNDKVANIFSVDDAKRLKNAVSGTSEENPIAREKLNIMLNGCMKECEIVMKVKHNDGEPSEIIGKILEV